VEPRVAETLFPAALIEERFLFAFVNVNISAIDGETSPLGTERFKKNNLSAK
jgi:hypothetical protein